MMLVSEFDYELPEELIAQTPPKIRGSSRMLVLDRETGSLVDDQFARFPEYLRTGDVLVVNDSRVLPARLYATRVGQRTQASSPAPSGRVEVLLTGQVGAFEWTALVRPGRKVQAGERLVFASETGEAVLTAEVLAAGEFGERTLLFAPDAEFLAKVEQIGHMPLPPYIHRDDAVEDRARYQTVYADRAGSAAAPTAGLHFTPEILEAIRAKGVLVQTVTLHVGLGTFQPVRVETVEAIRLHTERYTLSAETAAAVNAAMRDGRRVIAVGTTSVRVLEHCASLGPELSAHSGETAIFIAPGSRFRVVSGLLTNFHLPQSTLLMLVSALTGVETVQAAYLHAVRKRYSFFSYGDCMFVD